MIRVALQRRQKPFQQTMMEVNVRHFIRKKHTDLTFCAPLADGNSREVDTRGEVIRTDDGVRMDGYEKILFTLKGNTNRCFVSILHAGERHMLTQK